MYASGSHEFTPWKTNDMKKKAATKRHAIGVRNGRVSGRRSVRTCAGSSRVSQSHTRTSPTVKAENARNGACQPPNAWASGTATADAAVAPVEIAVAYTPVANAGRSAKLTLTQTGSRALARPIPIPTGR
jgi:hypothetical protein